MYVCLMIVSVCVCVCGRVGELPPSACSWLDQVFGRYGFRNHESDEMIVCYRTAWQVTLSDTELDYVIMTKMSNEDSICKNI